jgi:hypothetical protein
MVKVLEDKIIIIIIIIIINNPKGKGGGNSCGLDLFLFH